MEPTLIQLHFHKTLLLPGSLKCKVIQFALQLDALNINNQRDHHNIQWTTL